MTAFELASGDLDHELFVIAVKALGHGNNEVADLKPAMLV